MLLLILFCHQTQKPWNWLLFKQVGQNGCATKLWLPPLLLSPLVADVKCVRHTNWTGLTQMQHSVWLKLATTNPPLYAASKRLRAVENQRWYVCQKISDNLAKKWPSTASYKNNQLSRRHHFHHQADFFWPTNNFRYRTGYNIGHSHFSVPIFPFSAKTAGLSNVTAIIWCQLLMMVFLRPIPTGRDGKPQEQKDKSLHF